MNNLIYLHPKVKAELEGLSWKKVPYDSTVWKVYQARLENGRKIRIHTWSGATFLEQEMGTVKIDHNATEFQVEKALRIIDAYKTHDDATLNEEEVINLLQNHDWTFMMSDDSRYYNKGRWQRRRILEKLRELPFERAKELWDMYKSPIIDEYTEKTHTQNLAP